MYQYRRPSSGESATIERSLILLREEMKMMKLQAITWQDDTV